MLHICQHPVIKDRINHLRNITTGPDEFRRHLRQIAAFLAYEASREFEIKMGRVQTPLEEMDAEFLAIPDPILVSILRAGNGFLEGALDVFPKARVGFLGMYRDEDTLTPVHYYAKIPQGLASAPAILLDPMLATGNSARDAIEYLKAQGAQQIILITLVCAPEGVARIHDLDPDIQIYTGALDRGLNEKGYIVPGLGDAGDRIFNSAV